MAFRRVPQRTERHGGRSLQWIAPPPEILQLYLGSIRRVFETGEPGEREEWYRFGSQDVWLNVRSIPLRDEQGRVTAVMGVCRNVTDRKRAEDALKKAHDELDQTVKQRTAELWTREEEYRTLLETSPDAVIMTDLEGHITFASRQTAAMYGSGTVDELRGRNPLDFFAPEDHQRFLANLEKTIEEGITRNVEYSFLRKDGTRMEGEVSAAVIRDASGTPTAVVAILRDVTQRRQAQEALERERRSLWNMLQASDQERQTISYEIHDGLAQYLAAAGMQFQTYEALRENSPQKAKKAYETALELVRQAHFEARRLISQVRPPVIDEIGLETAISHLVLEQRRRGGPRIRFDSAVQFDRLPAILENSLYRIAQEALTNACTHSKSKEAKVTLAQDGQNVRLEVQDWGVGFDPDSEEIGHFGLEGIRQRVRLLGGRLRIESRPGSGTLVQVVVPIVEKPIDG